MGKLAQLGLIFGALLLSATLTGCVISLTAGSLDFRNNPEAQNEESSQDLTP